MPVTYVGKQRRSGYCLMGKLSNQTQQLTVEENFFEETNEKAV